MPIPPGRCRSLLILMALLASGCGAETYRARLNNTAQYFAYQQELQEELGPARSESGVTIQPPKQFRWIDPPPPPELDENGEPVAVDTAEDPRQPHYLGLQLPGLLGAWEADVLAQVGGQDEPRKAYLYLLGNHERHLQATESEDPKTYLVDLETLLSGTIGVVLPEGTSGNGTQKNQRYQEVAPRTEPNSKFSPRKDFTAVTLSPQLDVGDLEFKDLPFEMQLYEWDGRHVQVALLMVYPQSISPRERLHERLLLGLETLVVNDNPPTPASQAGGGGGVTPGGGTTAF